MVSPRRRGAQVLFTGSGPLADRNRLALENAALRHQLVVLKRSVKRPRIKHSDRIFFVKPETIVRWLRNSMLGYASVFREAGYGVLLLEHFLDLRCQDFRPIDHAGHLPCPVLIVSGTEDRSTWAPDTETLYAAAAEHRELWLVPEAAHEDLYRRSPEKYSRRVLGFLRRWMLEVMEHLGGGRKS